MAGLVDWAARGTCVALLDPWRHHRLRCTKMSVSEINTINKHEWSNNIFGGFLSGIFRGKSLSTCARAVNAPSVPVTAWFIKLNVSFQVKFLIPRCPSNCCQRFALALTGDVRLFAAGARPSSAVVSVHRGSPSRVPPGAGLTVALMAWGFQTDMKTSVIGENRRKLITKAVVIRYFNRWWYCSHVVYKNHSRTLPCLLTTASWTNPQCNTARCIDAL